MFSKKKQKRPQKNVFFYKIFYLYFVLKSGNADCTLLFEVYRPVGQTVTRSSLKREVRGSNLGPVKSNTVLPTVRHRCDISSKVAVLPGRNDEMGPANSLHASTYCSEYNERFDYLMVSHCNPMVLNFQIPSFIEAFLKRCCSKLVLLKK